MNNEDVQEQKTIIITSGEKSLGHDGEGLKQGMTHIHIRGAPVRASVRGQGR